MSFDFDSLSGYGGVGGIIGAFLTFLGFKSRLDKADEIIKQKQDKEVCGAIHKGIDEKIIAMIEIQKEIRERIDSLNDYVRNQK